MRIGNRQELHVERQLRANVTGPVVGLLQIQHGICLQKRTCYPPPLTAVATSLQRTSTIAKAAATTMAAAAVRETRGECPSRAYFPFRRNFRHQ